MRELIISFVLLLIGLLALYAVAIRQINTDQFLGRKVAQWIDFNEIQVDDNESIKIWDSKNELIFSEGKKCGNFPRNYGWNCFFVERHDTLQYSVCHYKKNNWHVNKYEFLFPSEGDLLRGELRLVGPDSSATPKMFYQIYGELKNDQVVVTQYDHQRNVGSRDTIELKPSLRKFNFF